jgi:hypothetical protein
MKNPSSCNRMRRRLKGYRRECLPKTVQPEARLRTALVYDFDGTLAHGNAQEHSFFPKLLNIRKADFWNEVRGSKEKHNADENLIFLYLMLKLAAERGVSITRQLLREHGRTIPLFIGVDRWFDRINAFAAERGLALEHYIISSGNGEIIEGSPIASRFIRIFASRYLYDDQGVAIWPATSINYTSKTQFLFRINKGILNYWNSEGVNRWMPPGERPIPFSRIIYLGDGDTDIPSMKMVRYQGGHSVAVFDLDTWQNDNHQEKVYNLIAEDRAHYVVPGDYRQGSLLDVTIKGILGKIARDEAGYRTRL